MLRFSVILPVYNGSEFIEEAIRSVLGQSFEDIELLIIDDGSTDETREIVDSIRNTDKRIKYYYRSHYGLAESLNFGLDYSCGEFIARIDADDRWLTDKLSIQNNLLKENPKITLLGSSVYYINSEGKRIPELSGFNQGKEIQPGELQKHILRNNVICSSSLVFHKSIVNAIGNFNTKYETSMDYDFLVRALEHNKGLVSEKALVEYRISRNMMTLRKRGKMIRESSRIRLNALKAYNVSINQRLIVIKDIIGLYLGGISYIITGQHPLFRYLG